MNTNAKEICLISSVPNRRALIELAFKQLGYQVFTYFPSEVSTGRLQDLQGIECIVDFADQSDSHVLKLLDSSPHILKIWAVGDSVAGPTETLTTGIPLPLSIQKIRDMIDLGTR